MTCLGHTESKTKNLFEPYMTECKVDGFNYSFLMYKCSQWQKAHCSNMTIDTTSSVSHFHMS